MNEKKTNSGTDEVQAQGTSRRTFLKAAAIAGAGAGLAGCKAPDQILPLIEPDPRQVLGRAQQFNTVCRECPAGCGMFARVNSGRTTKVEGNPSHPINHGKLCLRGQSSVQGLYNPDRFQQPMLRDNYGALRPVSWEVALQRWQQELDAVRDPSGLVWMGHLETGSLDALIREWLASRGAPPPMYYEYFSYDALRAGYAATTGRAVVPTYHLERAKYLFNFGAEFLETWVSNIQFAGAFAAMHSVGHTPTPARTVCVGPRLSLTAANADEWWPARPGTEALLAWMMLQQVETRLGRQATLPAGVQRPQLDLATVARQSEIEYGLIELAAQRLVEHRPSLVLGPGFATDNRSAVMCQIAVNLLNDVLGNTGVTVTPDVPHALTGTATQAQAFDLLARAERGEVHHLLLHHANPAYHQPHWAFTLEKIPFIVSFASWMDETTRFAHLVLPDNEFLESWGDYSPHAGLTGILQPTRVPVYDTRQTGDLLVATLGGGQATTALNVPTAPTDPMEAPLPDFGAYLRTRWVEALGSEAAWNAMLVRGWTDHVPPASAAAGAPGASAGTAPAVVTSTGAGAHVTEPVAEPAAFDGNGGLTMIVFPSVQLFDGRQANRTWAQEIAEPMSKLAWDGWCELHPDTAKRLGFSPSQVLRLRSPHGQIEMPLFITTWIRPDCLGVLLGQGHTHYGMWANQRGDLVHWLQAPAPEADGRWVPQTVRVQLEDTGKSHQLANLQMSKLQWDKRLAQAVLMDEYSSEAAHEQLPALSFYHYHHAYVRHRWGMAIDLSSCIGCNACQAACYAENNVAIFGRGGCLAHREMTWIRVEMFEGESAHPSTALNPDIRFMPVPCQQCGNAPCEYVCPVFAAYHTDEGLNAQVYNRCVGTRYCSNNCIYKVRRFNWYTPQFPPPLNQQLNPNVTVRAKGVMEKCTFCVQRIEKAELDAMTNHREIHDGEIQTACQQTCPTNAIVFGDLLDPSSWVSRLAGEERAYGLLAEENTYPAIRYLKKAKFELNNA